MPRKMLKDKILELVEARQYVTYAEFERFFPEHKEDPPLSRLVHGSVKNIIYWIGMDQEFADAVAELTVEKLIFMHPTPPLTYLIDGAGLALPLVKRPPKNGYEKPHWLPVTFCTHPAYS